ncbi:MAG: arginine--tRNA ligase [Candidatus Hydrogenedentes bacterium]|nr:arginine--tRNA ligase [Candidatus Hydrogenedentota bacterium]
MNPFERLVTPILAAFPELGAEDISVGAPPKLDMGDVAIPMFLAARKLKAAPPKLAAEAAQKVAFGPEVTEAKPMGPYLNLRLDRGAFGRAIVSGVLEAGDRFGSNNLGAGRKVVLEHTSINPNASPHVGRARNAMIGDSLARLFRFEGHDVEVHYYVNDMGRQIGLLVLIAEELQDLTFDQILDAYVAANERAKEDEAFAQAGYELLAKMEQGDPETQKKFTAVTDLCLKGQLDVLQRLGGTYDVFDHESKYVKDPRLDEIVARLKEKDAVFTDEDGRLVVDLAQIGHTQDEGRFFVLLRGNGSSMYGFRDLAYTLDKEALGADINLMVLGEDHKLYAQQLALILEAAGHSAPEPIYYAYILLKSGKMSTRQGKVVLLSEFLDEASRLAHERVAEQCQELSKEEQHAIAEQVAVAAIRFSVLRVTPNKNVIFDMEENMKFVGDTGPYIQYSCARINSIMRKYEGALPDAPPTDFPLAADAEWALLAKINEFPNVVAAALNQRVCAPIANYALELARLFSSFYNDCPVLKAESEALVAARLLLCRATLQTLKNALGILGIEAPERM